MRASVEATGGGQVACNLGSKKALEDSPCKHVAIESSYVSLQGPLLLLDTMVHSFRSCGA